MMEIITFYLKYDIPNHGWWTPEYVDRVESVEDLINEWFEYKRKIETADAYTENEPYFKDYAEFHKLVYLMETLVGEANVKGSMKMSTMENYLQRPDDSRTSLKINNLKNAMEKLFPQKRKFSDSASQLPIEQFTPEFILDIHKEVASSLMDEVGMYRKTWCAPSQEAWTYLRPEKIPECLDSLCKFVRDELIKEQSYRPLGRD